MARKNTSAAGNVNWHGTEQARHACTAQHSSLTCTMSSSCSQPDNAGGVSGTVKPQLHVVKVVHGTPALRQLAADKCEPRPTKTSVLSQPALWHTGGWPYQEHVVLAHFLWPVLHGLPPHQRIPAGSNATAMGPMLIRTQSRREERTGLNTITYVTTGLTI